MVFASSVFIFASMSIWQILLAGMEHFRKVQMASSEHLEYFVLLRKFFASRNLSFINRKRCFATSNS